MKKLLVLVLVAVLGWQGYARYQASQASQMTPPPGAGLDGTVELLSTVDVAEAAAPAPIKAAIHQPAPRPPVTIPAPASRFACDGRTYCSQMHSCEEATFFLKNCPGTKMDGDHDGIPCESQWCS
jgi:hypothetical protein